MRSAIAIFIASALIVGCATVTAPPTGSPATPAAPATPPSPEPPAKPAAIPPPPVNLQGFPPAYQQGFADGCGTSRGTDKKDATRYAQDGSYRIGWIDGLAQCKKK
jgi:hypothetical protein